MFDHVTIGVSDLAASRRFYVEALGLPTHDGDYAEWGAFTIAAGDAPLTRNLNVGFGVEDRDAVDGWWNRMTEAGYPSDGEPGPRPQYNDTYYGAFVLDPDGNSVEAVHHRSSVARGIDHLWLRTRDVAAEKRFYETIAPVVGLRLVHDAPDKVRITDGEGSFTFVVGEPTEHVHLAFGAPDFAAVERFHDALTAAGYRSNGEPGERPHYHPGYYGAYVFDPDGHNVEAVFRDRP
ncbi:MAG TPA: VOC family protein [Gaiellaceae bacterium]|nr:VOC family protein [Gaiellaceae bacterium]